MIPKTLNCTIVISQTFGILDNMELSDDAEEIDLNSKEFT